MSVLQLRLKNCLQTIIDLQPAMRQSWRANFTEDFTQIRSWITRVDNMDLDEDDVRRLENMTAEFLREAQFAGPTVPAGRLQ